MDEKNNMEQSIQELEMNLEHEKNKNEVLENEKKKMQEVNKHSVLTIISLIILGI